MRHRTFTRSFAGAPVIHRPESLLGRWPRVQPGIAGRPLLFIGLCPLAVFMPYILVNRTVTSAFALAILPAAIWLGLRPLGGLYIGLALILTLPSWLTVGAAQGSIGRLASVAAASSLLINRRVHLRWHVADYALAALFAVIILGWILQYDATHSGRVVSDELTPIGFYIGARAVPRNRLSAVMAVVLFAGTIGALTVLYEGLRGYSIFISPTQYRWDTPGTLFRPGGIFGSPPEASTALCIVFLFGLGALAELRGKVKAAAIVCLVICAFALISTFTRAPLIAAAVGILLFLWLTRSPLLRPMRVVWFGVVLVAIILISLPRLEGNSTFQLGLVRPGTLAEREGYWQIALPIATDNAHNFIFGIGTAALETPQVSAAAPLAADLAIRPQSVEDSLHSEYVTTLVEQGVIGLVAVAFFFASALVPAARVARRDGDPCCAALAAGIVSVAIVMTVDTVFLDSVSFSLIMLTTGLAATIGGQAAATRPGAYRPAGL